MTRGAARILDEYLVAAARTGDAKALGLLAERWHRKLTGHAWRLIGDPEEARDVAQNCWVEIQGGIHRLRDERAFPAWAYRVVSRRCASSIGAAVRRRQIAEEVRNAPSPTAEEPGVRLDHARLRTAMADLPPDQRSAIALYYLEDMSVAEVAVALSIPAGTVKTRLMHARRKLRATLEGDTQ